MLRRLKYSANDFSHSFAYKITLLVVQITSPKNAAAAHALYITSLGHDSFENVLVSPLDVGI